MGEAYWPTAIKDFVTYQDQPPPAPPATDLTIIYAQVIEDLHDEVEAVEEGIGPRPFLVPGTTTMGGSVQWLWHNKAAWPHTHPHNYLGHLDRDDHTEYVRTSGERGFSGPVGSPPAWDASQLARLDQIQNAGWLTILEFEYILALMFDGQPHVTGCGGTPWMYGPPTPSIAWKITGGWTYGYTDGNGNIFVNFGSAFAYTILTFCFMRMPVPGRSHYGYTYQYMEDQLILEGLSTSGAVVQFREDNTIDSRAWVTMSWIAVGY